MTKNRMSPAKEMSAILTSFFSFTAAKRLGSSTCFDLLIRARFCATWFFLSVLVAAGEVLLSLLKFSSS